MERVLTCECGFETRAADETELVAAIRRHALEAHGMVLSPDEALVIAFQAAPALRQTAARPDEEE